MNKIIPTLILITLISIFTSCKKTSDGETVPFGEKIYKVEILEFDPDIVTGRLEEKTVVNEITAEDDSAAAVEGFLTYVADIKAYCKLKNSDAGNLLSIPKFYSVYDEDGNLLPRIKGEEKQEIIKMALKDDDIKIYKENLPPYHFEYSALMCD